MKHIKTPVRIVESCSGLIIEDAETQEMCSICFAEGCEARQRDIAEKIVKACNNFEKLVDVLRGYIGLYTRVHGEPNGINCDVCDEINRLKQLLAELEEPVAPAGEG